MEPSENYVGEQLVSDESFMRRLPVAVVLENRLRIDAIVIACDILGQAYQDLNQLGARIGANLDSLDHSMRAAAIGLCWSIVDQLHAVRQLLTPTAPQTSGPATQRFLEVSAPATTLRNKMDHLRTNLKNLAEKKGSRFPLFGALSYVLSNDDPETGGFLMTISSGALHGGEMFPAVNPVGKTYTVPIGLLQLHAFDITLEFSPVFAAFRDYVRVSERRNEDSIRAAANEEASKGKHTVDELLAHLGGVPAIAMQFDFGTSET